MHSSPSANPTASIATSQSAGCGGRAAAQKSAPMAHALAVASVRSASIATPAAAQSRGSRESLNTRIAMPVKLPPGRKNP